MTNHEMPAFTAKQMADAARSAEECCNAHLHKDICHFEVYNKNDRAVKEFTAKARQICESVAQKEVLIACLADMSAGKSSIINSALLGYPLLPVAAKTTSSCPIEVRYGSPELKVYAYSLAQDTASIKGAELFRFDNPRSLSDSMKRRLLQYVVHMDQKNVLHLKNLEYVYDVSSVMSGDCSFIFRDRLLLMQLMLIVLNAYIGQNNCDLAAQRQDLIEERNSLLRDLFNISDLDMPYGVDVRMESDVLLNNTVLVDLPGLSSGNELHTEITKHYIKCVDAFVLSFDVTAYVEGVNDALKELLKLDKMRMPGKDERFVVILNKCDQCARASAAKEIAQAVNDITPLLKGVHASTIYPISAWYGDYRLLENGIAPEKTPIGQTYRDMMPDISDEELANILKRNYEYEFSYQNDSGKLITCSTKKFAEDIISSRAPRMLLLNAFDKMNELKNAYSTLLSAEEMDAALLDLLMTCGDRLMKMLLDMVIKAFKEMQTQFVEAMDQSRLDQDQRNRDLSTKLDTVKASYMNELDRAQKVMKSYVKSEADQMKSNIFGDYIIEGKKGKRAQNADIYNTIIQYLENFSFDSYLEDGDEMLEKHLNEERKNFNGYVTNMAKLLMDHKETCGQKLDAAYEKFLQQDEVAELSNDVRSIFGSCFKAAKKSILTYMGKIIDQLVAEMENNTSMEAEIDETLSSLPEFTESLTSYYHDKCTEYIRSQRARTSIRELATLDVDGILDQIEKPFVSNDSCVNLLSKLDGILSNSNIWNSHASRMLRAFDRVTDDFQARLLDKIADFTPTITHTISNQFEKGEKSIQKVYMEMKSMADDVDATLNTLCEPDSGAMLLCRMAHNLDWACETSQQLVKDLTDCHTNWVQFAVRMHEKLQKN